jgi:uncharacterized protein YecA (UPF0149 family)
MKITSKTLISMRSAANAVLVAGAITGTSQATDSSSVRAEAIGFNSTPYHTVSSVKINEEAKEPEKKAEKKEPEKDPCPFCGRG